MSIETMVAAGKEYLDAKNAVEVLQEKIKFMDREDVGYYASIELEFKGMYRRSSTKIGITEAELKDIINNRLNEAITKRDSLKKKIK